MTGREEREVKEETGKEERGVVKERCANELRQTGIHGKGIIDMFRHFSAPLTLAREVH